MLSHLFKSILPRWSLILSPIIFIINLLGLPSMEQSVELRKKQDHCTEILNQLKKAKGMDPLEKPFVSVQEFLEGDLVLAMFSAMNGNIVIQTDTYDICMNLMDADSTNALAFILAHELAHFTNKHNVRQKHIKKYQSFDRNAFDISMAISSRSFRDTSTRNILAEEINQINRKYRIMKNEAEADLDAGFTCFLAGYQAFPAGVKFLDECYEVFSIDTTEGNYASLSERKFIIRKTAKELDTLIHVFTAGNYAMCIRDYDAAKVCYKYVSEKYPSYQIFNNLGVLYLMAAISIHDSRYVYPLSLEMDLHDFVWVEPFNQFGHSAGGPPIVRSVGRNLDFNSYIQNIKQRTQNAIKYFKRSLEINPNYHVAQLNSSIAHSYLFGVDIQNERTPEQPFKEPYLLEAEAYAIRAIKTAENSKSYTDGLIQLGIVRHAAGDSTNSHKYLQMALDESPENNTAKMNLEFITHKVGEVGAFFQGEAIRDGQNNCVSPERSHGVILSSPHSVNWSGNIFLKGEEYEEDYNWTLNYSDIGSNRLYALQNISPTVETSKKLHILIQSVEEGDSTICSVKYGDTFDSIKSNYGKPDQLLETNSGSMYLYELRKIDDTINKTCDGIVFQLNAKNKISGWASFYRRFSRF